MAVAVRHGGEERESNVNEGMKCKSEVQYTEKRKIKSTYEKIICGTAHGCFSYRFLGNVTKQNLEPL